MDEKLYILRRPIPFRGRHLTQTEADFIRKLTGFRATRRLLVMRTYHDSDTNGMLYERDPFDAKLYRVELEAQLLLGAF